MNYLARLQQVRQKVRRGQELRAVLGNGSGNPYAGSGRYWVRFPAGVDANGLTTYGAALPVRYGGTGQFPAKENVEVLVWRDPVDDVLSISRIAPDYPARAGFDSRILNSADGVTRFVDVMNFIRLMCRPPGSIGGTTSTLLTVREDPFYVNEFMDWQSYAGTIAAASKIDVASLIPAADTHLLCIGWMDRYLNTPFVTVSTAQALTSDLDSTDYDECFTSVNVHNECEPLAAFELADNAGSIDINNLVEDLRNWLPSRKLYGFPGNIPANKTILLRSTHQQIVNRLCIQGHFINLGTVIVT